MIQTITKAKKSINHKSKKAANSLAKAVAVYAFRNGPVEDIHADGRISQEEMKILNKNMVERLGEVFYLMAEWRSEDLRRLLDFSGQCASSWDDITLDELEDILSLLPIGEFPSN